MNEKPFQRVKVFQSETVPTEEGGWRKAAYAAVVDIPYGSDIFNTFKDIEHEAEMALAEWKDRVKPSAPSVPETTPAQIPGPTPPLPLGYQSAAGRPTPQPPPAQPKPSSPTGTTLEKVKAALKPYEGLLDFRELPKTILIFPREWIGGSVWAEINDLVLSFPEGLWMGKDKVQDPKTVHWEIPK